MELKEFKLTRNKQRPDFCYHYRKATDKRLYSIFTMDGGKTFLASIEEPRADSKWYFEFSETYNSIQECLDALTNFIRR